MFLSSCIYALIYRRIDWKVHLIYLIPRLCLLLSNNILKTSKDRCCLHLVLLDAVMMQLVSCITRSQVTTSRRPVLEDAKDDLCCCGHLNEWRLNHIHTENIHNGNCNWVKSSTKTRIFVGYEIYSVLYVKIFVTFCEISWSAGLPDNSEVANMSTLWSRHLVPSQVLAWVK